MKSQYSLDADAWNFEVLTVGWSIYYLPRPSSSLQILALGMFQV